MQKIYKFTLPEVVKERTVVLNGRYGFKDGVMELNEAEGKLVERILVPFHGCTLEIVEVKDSKDIDAIDTTLAKVSTAKGVVTSSTPAEVQVADAAANAAESEARPAPTGTPASGTPATDTKTVTK